MKLTQPLYAIGLLLIGITLLAATLYQVKISDPDIDDYHMGIQMEGVYEWRTRNIYISIAGFAFLACGAIMAFKLLIDWTRSDEEDTAEETYFLNLLIAIANEGDEDAENWLYAHGYEPLEE